MLYSRPVPLIITRDNNLRTRLFSPHYLHVTSHFLDLTHLTNLTSKKPNEYDRWYDTCMWYGKQILWPSQSSPPPIFMSCILTQRSLTFIADTWRLFMVHGANEDEAHLTEVACSITQLRSHTSFVLVDSKNGTVFIWHGSGSSDVLKEVNKLKIIKRYL